LDANKLAAEGRFWETRLADFKRPYLTLMVGGDTKNKKFNGDKLGQLVNNLGKKIKESGGTLLVSSSRRTNSDCVSKIKSNLSENNYFFEWTPDAVLNPYYGFLALSDLIIITGESISMICEALTLKKSVLVYMPEESLDSKHKDFCRSLMEKNLVREIKLGEEDLGVLETDGINELERIRDEILLKIKAN
jgi:mitochondrial fission protein ELM1